MALIKYDVSRHEYEIQNLIYKMGIIAVPKVINFKLAKRNRGNLTMELIPRLNLSDMFGENLMDVPDKIIQQCRNIIWILYENHIEYPDITGYNFIEYNHKIWLIDFEHARVNYNYDTYDPFIVKFINGCDMWNPSYV